MVVNLARYLDEVKKINPLRRMGKVTRVIGLTVEASGVEAAIGEICHVDAGGRRLHGEVVGFRNRHTLIMPLGDLSTVGPGAVVIPTRKRHEIRVGPGLLGRVIDGLGRPVDGKGEIEGELVAVHRPAPDPLRRRRIEDAVATGIRAIDAFATCGCGQRMGIFSGSGVGKSTLLGMIARHTDADVIVIGLIGERGREVLDFIQRALGPEGLKRSVVVVATSDQPALVRIRGAFVATTVAEYFRDRGMNVMLMIDSITRLAMAQREVGLAIGEPPTTKGFPPSVFALLPKLLERAGATENGSITGLYTVLVDQDDLNDPIADALRSILDGHIVLSRELAQRNHFPAIDVLGSVSRLMPDVAGPEHRELAARGRELLAAYREVEDLINIGAYEQGSNPLVDEAIAKRERIMSFLRQGVDEFSSLQQTLEMFRFALE